MKTCPFCTGENYDDAIFCRHCQRLLALQAPYNRPFDPQASVEKPKKPWLAVALNLFPLVFGLGFLYLGNGRRFFIMFLLQYLALASIRQYSLTNPVVILLVLLWLYSLFDAYSQAKIYNRDRGFE
jgi:hypothetical protein